MIYGSPIMAAFANAGRRLARPVVIEPMADPASPIADTEGGEVDCSTAPPHVKRRLQCVSTKSAKVRVLNWMQDEAAESGTERNLISSAVRQFPDIFRADSYNANLMKCSRWWAEREQLFADFEWDQRSLSHSFVGWRKRVELKARPGRGRKTSDWNTWLYPLVRSEFERLRKSGVKFSADVLVAMARNILLQSSHPTFGPSMIVPTTGKSMIDSITLRWVQQFMEVQGIVCRVQCGKLQVSDEKTQVIERATAYHMGVVARGFASGELNEDLLENMDETHFIVNMDNGKTLGFRGDTEVRYADVVSGGLGITMVVKVTGGRAGKICTPMLIFQNCNSSYPIRGTPDNVAGVCYRSSPSSFMTSSLMSEYYSEPRVSWADGAGRTKIQFIDNCPGHNEIATTTEALARIRTQIRFFPANSTHLTQPCDSFVISKIKDAWRRRWDQKKMELIGAHMWQGDGREGTSGALQNPGWSYYLQLAADSVRDVNAQIDAHYGITYARKAMIQCGLSLNLDGSWNVKQLTPELQKVIAKYRANFEGSMEGLQPLSVPRRIRRLNAGSGQGTTEGNSGDGTVVGRSRGRGRGRGTATANISVDSAAGFGRGRGLPQARAAHPIAAEFPQDSEVVESGALRIDPPLLDAGQRSVVATVIGSTTATTWAATRPGARIHRNQARKARATVVALESQASAHTEVATSSVVEDNA